MSHQVIENLRTVTESFLGKLRTADGFSGEEFERLCRALQLCIEIWAKADSLPKELANILLDLWPGVQSTAFLYQEQEASVIMKAADKIADMSREICSTSHR